MRHVLKASSALLALLLAIGSAGTVVCEGWGGTQQDRMECCRRAGHQNCVEQGLSDSCCAGQEDAQQLAPAGDVTLLVAPGDATGPVPVGFSALPAASGAALPSTIDIRPHAPPPSLIVPLRI
jgi:hypothetical protein